MKKYKNIIIIIIALAVVIAGSALAYNTLSDKYSPKSPEASGQQKTALKSAPDFTVMNTENNMIRLSNFKGKPVIINFWASWCGPCKLELPAFDKAYAEYGNQIEFLMVNLTDGVEETVDGTNQFVAENGYTFPVYFDVNGSAAKAYKTYSIPLTVFIDSDGNIVKSRTGSMDESVLYGYINNLINK